MGIVLTGAAALEKFLYKTLAVGHPMSQKDFSELAKQKGMKFQFANDKLDAVSPCGNYALHCGVSNGPTTVNLLLDTLKAAPDYVVAGVPPHGASYKKLVGEAALTKLNWEGWAGSKKIAWLKGNLPIPGQYVLTQKTFSLEFNWGGGALTEIKFAFSKEPGFVDKMIEAIKKMATKPQQTVKPQPDTAAYQVTTGHTALEALVEEKIINSYTADKISNAMILLPFMELVVKDNEILVKCNNKDGPYAGKKMLLYKNKQPGAALAAVFSDVLKATSDWHSTLAVAVPAGTPEKELEAAVGGVAMNLLTGKQVAETTKPVTDGYHVHNEGFMLHQSTYSLSHAVGLYCPVHGTGAHTRYFLVADYEGLKLAGRIKGDVLSLRVEGGNLAFSKDLLSKLGFDTAPGTYSSVHLKLSEGGLPPITDAKRAYAAVLAGLDDTYVRVSPAADMSLLAGKGA